VSGARPVVSPTWFVVSEETAEGFVRKFGWYPAEVRQYMRLRAMPFRERLDVLVVSAERGQLRLIRAATSPEALSMLFGDARDPNDEEDGARIDRDHLVAIFRLGGPEALLAALLEMDRERGGEAAGPR
jgi:hypothetical protein